LTSVSIFLFVGLITLASAPFVYWFLDNNIPSARFLTPQERVQAFERLRANQTGTGSGSLKWQHVLELPTDIYLYIVISSRLRKTTFY